MGGGRRSTRCAAPVLAAAALALAACAPLPPSPQDIRAKQFERVPDKAVIYIVRDFPDFSDRAATVSLGDTGTITTYPGTYYRWAVNPGTHRIAGFAGDAGAFTLQVEAGRLYFVRQSLSPSLRFPQSYFHAVSEQYGRTAVGRSELISGP